MRTIAFALIVLIVGCSSSADDKSNQAECDQIAADIRKAADQRGIASEGVCSSTSTQIQKDFANACQRLKDCNDRCCK